MENIIKRVTSVNFHGTKSFEVGIDEVIEIVNNSLEYDDHVHIQFDAYTENGKLLGSFINLPVAVDYFN